MNEIHPRQLHELIEDASKEVGLLWPLDRAVAVNPLLDRLDTDFLSAVGELEVRLGGSLWPLSLHLEEASRRGLIVDDAVPQEEHELVRLPTLFGRIAGVSREDNDRARSMVGHILLEAVTIGSDSNQTLRQSAASALRLESSWIDAPRPVRHAVARRIEEHDLGQIVQAFLGWSNHELTEEMARHFARLPGWAAWAKWNDVWARAPHDAGLSRQDFLLISLAVDLSLAESLDSSLPAAPVPLTAAIDEHLGVRRLLELDHAVHGEMLERLAPRPAPKVPLPRLQVVTCIDVRSEPLRHALERNPEVETFGFAGFFGVFATVHAAGERETYESLPVLAKPTDVITGGTEPTALDTSWVEAEGVLAELTHEPGSMFALAEATGFLTTPWMLARNLLPGVRVSTDHSAGTWQLSSRDRAQVAEGALRGMGLTKSFAQEILLLGHASSTVNNPHFATLECGACAGHGGGPNAAALAEVLNDREVRHELFQRGIAIPDDTRFLSGVHDTTLEEVVLHQVASEHVQQMIQRATNEVAAWRAGVGSDRGAKARRLLTRRSRDWAETRPEWGLANHVAFVVAPRSSIRGIDLHGQSFLHSYDPDADTDGVILRSIMTAPMVVAQWINASYYFSSVAPEVLGAGDKTLLNPVGDFAVIAGDDPDLRLGLPLQSVCDGQRPVHLPVRLLVAVEAPRDRLAEVVRNEPVVRQLADGEWIHLVCREGPEDEWSSWIPGGGWGKR